MSLSPFVLLVIAMAIGVLVAYASMPVVAMWLAWRYRRYGLIAYIPIIAVVVVYAVLIVQTRRDDAARRVWCDTYSVTRTCSDGY